MTKNLVWTIVASSALMLSGCGESAEEISVKDKVIVLHDVGVTGCIALENFGKSKLEEQNTVANVSYTSRSNDETCDTYGKTKGDINYDDIDANIDIECAEITLAEIQEALPEEDLSIYENKDKSCVLAFDIIQ